MISSHTNPRSLATCFRQKRMRFLDEVVRCVDSDKVSIADVGGTRSFWEMNLNHLETAKRIERIDIYNLDAEGACSSIVGNVSVSEYVGDATHLEHVGDGEYDVVFSNSVIEHVGNMHQQCRFAQEMCRVATYRVIQTPNRYFPLEPHFYVPFFQFMPLSWRAELHRLFKLGWLKPEPDRLLSRVDCDQIRLLSKRELALLFPDDVIHCEWLMGMVKSFVVTGSAKR